MPKLFGVSVALGPGSLRRRGRACRLRTCPTLRLCWNRRLVRLSLGSMSRKRPASQRNTCRSARSTRVPCQTPALLSAPRAHVPALVALIVNTGRLYDAGGNAGVTSLCPRYPASRAARGRAPVAPRARRERLRHTQVSGEPQRAGHQRSPQRVPDHSLGVHARAARTGPSPRQAPSAETIRRDSLRPPNPPLDCERTQAHRGVAHLGTGTRISAAIAFACKTMLER